MQRVTLAGINRAGLSNWKARERWNRKSVHIWSGEHCMWWRPFAAGYTDVVANAGIWTFPDAYEKTKHCGPEKKISYYATTGD